MIPADEQKLIKKAKRGDERAFEELVLANEKQVYNLALKLTGSPDDALDISQDAFIKAYTALESFRGESRFSVWLYRLTYNAAMDFIRKTRSSNVISLTPDDENESSQADISDTAPSPEETAEKNDLSSRIRRAVGELPDNMREILVMREFSGMTYEEISDALDISEGTVKSRIARARAKLTEILKKDGTFSEFVSSNNWKGGREDA